MATKTDLVNTISSHLNYLSREDIKDSVDLILEYLQQELAQHNRVEIRGFGSFSIRERKFSRNNDKRANDVYRTVYFRMSKCTNF